MVSFWLDTSPGFQSHGPTASASENGYEVGRCCPHLEEPLDAMRLQQPDEVFERPGRVTDREDDRCHISSQS